MKFNKFEKAGVKEFWIIEPDGKFVSVITLQNNKRYGRPDVYLNEEKIKPSGQGVQLIDKDHSRSLR